ncbi:hypothetical protein Terro_2835 [Terriglobus roseus DSM 18391]|uniref:Uncharacterized protein n=1 Tax=Terriglobus roseus (strain DSM 18391 / NRRL B-41598 / KBS 63) TaxID=926566 RepID=I3ZIK3_TERRK|nr:hypothetical protein Terro_2835 [Terriglobus roseus DSM 18391]
MAEPNKIVIKLPDGPVKGYLAEDSLQSLRAASEEPDVVTVQLAENGDALEVSLQDAKGIFFVKDFDGRVDHADLRFHDSTTPAQFLWVRLTFLDGEVLEGMIQNACSYVISKGIWITPTDPTGNNLLIYASKSHLRHFEVLGLRQKSHRRAT